jgi:hypothetical protein
MTDFRDRVFKSRDESAIKRLASRIPGYGGYLDKEMRRDADKMLREYIAAQLEIQRKRLTELQQELLSGGGLALMDDAERVQKKLQLLIDRLRTAVYGYAGWFDAVTIGENELNALYDYDSLLLGSVDEVAAGVQELGHAIEEEGNTKGALSSLRELLSKLHEHFDKRRDVMIGAAEPPEAPPSPEPPASPEPPVVPAPTEPTS